MRSSYRALMTMQTIALLAIVLVAAFALTPGWSRVPQAIAGVALAWGLLSVLAIRTNALGARAFYELLARSDLSRDGVQAHRPFQFAATVAALLASVTVRTPAWLAEGVPLAAARFQADLAQDGYLKALWVWGIVTLLGSGVVLLLLAFAVLMIRHALTPATIRTDAEAANESILWNFLAAIVLASAELPELFSQRDTTLMDWRFWFSLFVALALAVRVAVLSLLFAHDHFALPLTPILAARALPVRIPRRVTALALVAMCAAHLVFEREVGVAYSASVVVLAAGPLARLLERLTQPAAA